MDLSFNSNCQTKERQLIYERVFMREPCRQMALESTLKDVPAFPAHPVHDVTERCQKTLHESAQIRLAGQEIQMKMIGHKAIATHIHIELT